MSGVADRLRKLAGEATEYRTGPTWFDSDEEGMAALRRREELRKRDAYCSALARELALGYADALDLIEGHTRAYTCRFCGGLRGAHDPECSGLAALASAARLFPEDAA